MYRRLGVWLLAAVICLGGSGCGKKAEKEENTANAANATDVANTANTANTAAAAAVKVVSGKNETEMAQASSDVPQTQTGADQDKVIRVSETGTGQGGEVNGSAAGSGQIAAGDASAVAAAPVMNGTGGGSGLQLVGAGVSGNTAVTDPQQGTEASNATVSGDGGGSGSEKDVRNAGTDVKGSGVDAEDSGSASSKEGDAQPEQVLLDIEVQGQDPELPTGCEMTSLTMALNYFGLPADKCDLSDNYLDKGPVGTVNFREAFEGDPRDPESYGCYAPVVVNTANRFLEDYGSELRAREVSGLELEDLFSYLQAGIPVIIWGTRNCEEGYYSVTWNVDGEDLTWFTPEHCMVLAGYDEAGRVWVADPLHADLRSYDKERFRVGYESLYRQAVVIQ